MTATCKTKKRKDIYDVLQQEKIVIDENERISRDDQDTSLIHALGNPNDMKFVDNIKGQELGENRRFSIRINSEIERTYIILKHEKDSKTGFEAAVIKDELTGNTILWADGSKGFSHWKDEPNEIYKDWLINDFLIGTGNIFPQLEKLYQFANDCINKYGITINEGIGQSMMGIGMSALSFLDGFENINFRTYSGCVDEKILNKLKEAGYKFNNKNGSNLESYYTPDEPLLNSLEPLTRDNKFFMKENISDDYKGSAHSAAAYNNTDGQNSDYFEISSFIDENFDIWALDPSVKLENVNNSIGLTVSVKVDYNRLKSSL